MTITRLHENSLDRYIGLSCWSEPVSTEPLSGPPPSETAWSREAEIDRIRASVRTILARADGLPVDVLFALRKPICLAALLGRASKEQYAVLWEICDILRGDQSPQIIASFEDETAWNQAIATTRRVRHFSNYDHYTLNEWGRPMAVAAACRRLETRGVAIVLTARGVGVDYMTFAAICADIERRIRRLGGRRVIDAIFEWFEINKRIYEGSLLYGRKRSQISTPRKPSIPWHFLYNIAWKHYDATLATLFEALAIPLDRLNKGYATPEDTSKRNSPYYPLYKISPDLYALPPRGMAARALFERIYTLLREAGSPQLERQMGAALEQMTAEAVGLTGHPPGYVGLQYRLPNQSSKKAPYELDVADQSDKDIFFLECKKKPLTNAARAGNVLSAAVDFASAFMMPLTQINRHEAQLRAGGITFLNGQTLTLGDRDIRRMAITMTDHGSMQDRMFLRAVLIGLWGATFTAKNPAHQAEVNKVTNSSRPLPRASRRSLGKPTAISCPATFTHPGGYRSTSSTSFASARVICGARCRR
jgi:hypothetical protein